MQAGPSKRKYTPEEKAQLLANLDLEVSHRARQFEAWLADALENFRMHQEGLISRVPRLVRDVTMKEFVKYNGDIQECLKGVQRDRLGGEVEGIDKSTRKRKWVEAQEVESSNMKAVKSARVTVATPQRKAGPSTGPGTLQQARLPITKTPGNTRTAFQRFPIRGPSPSPQKLGSSQLPILRGPTSRPGSPTKPNSPTKPSTLYPPRPIQRIPSSSTFNPKISSTNHPRWPRKDEGMLSLNGSPLANPLGFGLDLSTWLSRVEEANSEDDASSRGGDTVGQGKGGQRNGRPNSIIVRSASSMSNYTTATSNSNTTTSNVRGIHSRSNSQTSTTNTSTQPSHSQKNGLPPTRSGTSAISDPNSVPKTPPSQSQTLSSISLAALVAVPTKDGHLLEFDPFQTSPGEIDALQEITDSAKKQAKADMARLVMQAMERWKIG